MKAIFEDIENGYTIREDETTGQMFVGDIGPRERPSSDGMQVAIFLFRFAQAVVLIKLITVLWKGWQ